MTVERLNVTSGPYVGNGTTTAFPITFHAASPDEVGAYLDGVEVDRSRFSVSLDDDSTGTLTFFVAPVGALLLYSDPLFDQAVNFENQGPFFQASVNEPLDRSAVRDLYLLERLRRSPQIPLGASDAAGKIPIATLDGGWGLGTIPGDDGGFRVDAAQPSGATLIGYRRQSAALARSVSAAVASLGVTAGDFGAKFDGVTNDAPAIQAMVDAAAVAGVPVLLPAGTAIINAPIVFTDKRVDVRGVFGKTNIRAGLAIDRMFDLRNTEAGNDDGSFSPFAMEGIALEGDNKAAIGFDLKFVHNFDMRNVRATRCGTGLREMDTWLSRYHNVRIDSCGIGWSVVGAANSTPRVGCTITGCSDTHLRIRGVGTFSSSTEAMVWEGLDIEFGSGNGVDVGPNCYVAFQDCYLFEGVAGVGIINRGQTTIRGGTFYIGNLAGAVGIKPLGNTLLLDRVGVNGGEFAGVGDSLVKVTAAEIAAGLGTVEFRDIQSNFPPSSAGGMAGDFLAFARPGSNLVPSYGKDWSVAPAATAPTVEVGSNGRSRKVTAMPGTDFLGLFALLKSREYTIGKPLYQVYVLETNCPIYVQLAAGPQGAAPAAFTASQSAISGIFTLVVPTTNVSAEAYTHLNIARNGLPQVGDFITLHSASLGDARLVQANAGSLATLVKL